MAKEFSKKFYKSKEWKDCRERYASTRRHLCEDCLVRGIYSPGVIVHHVEELTPMNINDPETTLGFQNLKLVCRQCHADIHKKPNRNRRFLFGTNGQVFIRQEQDLNA